MQYVVAALYHFFEFPDCAERRDAIKAEFVRLGVRGTLLVTQEGINGTLSGTREAIDAMLSYIRDEVVKGAFEHKESICDYQPFKRTKVKLKKETISIGEAAPLDKRGQYVEAKDWNALITEPGVVVVDTRNVYEVEMGTFEGAVDPKTRIFKQLPAFARKNLTNKKQKIATFCTGGIRCEKFTAWLAGQGYEHVYHLKGGILKYIEEVPEAESKWRGECFVFDERVAVDHSLAPKEV